MLTALNVCLFVCIVYVGVQLVMTCVCGGAAGNDVDPRHDHVPQRDRQVGGCPACSLGAGGGQRARGQARCRQPAAARQPARLWSDGPKTRKGKERRAEEQATGSWGRAGGQGGGVRGQGVGAGPKGGVNGTARTRASWPSATGFGELGKIASWRAGGREGGSMAPLTARWRTAPASC